MLMKIYNMTNIVEFVYKMKTAGIYYFNDKNIRSRYAYQKLKELRKIENAEYVSRWMDDYSSQYEKRKVAKAFFPIKMEEIENSGRDYFVGHFYYADGKFHCLVCDGGAERHFKIKTSSYDEKMKPFIDCMNAWFKKQLDGFHGFYAVYGDTGNDYFITDRNLNSDGSYRRIVSVVGGVVVEHSGSFGKVYGDTKVCLANDFNSWTNMTNLLRR